jgi:hypothetical protein
METLPCESCILLAACISKPAVECKNLYTWLCSTHNTGFEYSLTKIDLSGNKWNRDRIFKLQKRFNRPVLHLMKPNHAIIFGRKVKNEFTL